MLALAAWVVGTVGTALGQWINDLGGEVRPTQTQCISPWRTFRICTTVLTTQQLSPAGLLLAHTRLLHLFCNKYMNENLKTRELGGTKLACDVNFASHHYP